MPAQYLRRDNLKGTEAETRIGAAVSDEFIPLGDFLVSDLRKRAPADRGMYRNSIERRVSGKGFKTRLVVFAGAPEAEYIEKGRKPGKAPPPNVLLTWVRGKGLGAKAFSVKTRRAISAGT